jgi:hypothetical protein
MTHAVLDHPCGQSSSGQASPTSYAMCGSKAIRDLNLAWVASVATALAYIVTLAADQSNWSWLALGASLASAALLVRATQREIASREAFAGR